MPVFGTGEADGRLYYAMQFIAGHPLDASAGPVITDFPIWLAETARVRSLALPDETPADVLDRHRDEVHRGMHVDPGGVPLPAPAFCTVKA